jgi:prophage regulatory protein
MQLLRLPEILNRTGLSRTALYAAVAAGTFPRPVKIGPNSKARAVAWPAHEIDDWISSRIAEREAA